MKSAARGKSTSRVEVQGITSHGIWLFVEGKEHFLSYKDYPWFRGATIDEICRVKLPSPGHLHWPDLDVDLEVDSLDSLTKYPLVYRSA